MHGPGEVPGSTKGTATMKKTSKKLVLSRETLADLETNLRQVAGGITLRYCYYSDGRATCATCDNATCTTNLC
jgi:hypothetical protein